jgi:hypothetical protein
MRIFQKAIIQEVFDLGFTVMKGASVSLVAFVVFYFQINNRFYQTQLDIVDV